MLFFLDVKQMNDSSKFYFTISLKKIELVFMNVFECFVRLLYKIFEKEIDWMKIQKIKPMGAIVRLYPYF